MGLGERDTRGERETWAESGTVVVTLATRCAPAVCVQLELAGCD